MHTCAAVSTAPGKGGIAVIRLSGDDCFEIAGRVFFPASGRSLSELKPNMCVYGSIVGRDNVVIDNGMCVCFHAPHSYTGENTVEISCHGSPVGTSMVLSALLENGAEMALPGEFTKRAFVNGKLDLTQAEAVGQLIDAKSSAALRLSVMQLGGAVGRKIRASADEITTLLASVYAYIDYPDEDMTDIPKEELSQRLQAIGNELSHLASTYSTGEAINEGIPAAIVGVPNTGKSSLLNMLSGFDRAIVTDVAGTTRDVVTQNVTVGNIRLLLSDTAGIRDTVDIVEKIGVEKSQSQMENSKVVLAVFDVSEIIDGSTRKMKQLLDNIKDTKNVVVVLNKCDKASPDEYVRYFSDNGYENIVCTSAKNGDGMESLENVFLRLYPDSDKIAEGNIISNARQYAALSRAASDVKRAVAALDTLTEDTACLDMESALSELLEADGRRVSEEIVNNIFSHFCVGK